MRHTRIESYELIDVANTGHLGLRGHEGDSGLILTLTQVCGVTPCYVGDLFNTLRP